MIDSTTGSTRSYCTAGTTRLSITVPPESFTGWVMTLSTYKCERCHGFQQVFARRKGVLEHTVLPLFFIRPIRCEECGDRYKTFGVASKRIVLRQHTVYVARWAAIVILSASAVGGLVALAISR
jgi:hypothetical protein